MRNFIIILTCALISACSPITFTSLKGKTSNQVAAERGYIIYPPIYVYSLEFENVGAASCKLSSTDLKPALMPDLSRPISVNFKSILGTSSVGLELVDGWLVKGLNVETDTAGVITEVAKIGAGILNPASAGNAAPLPPGSRDCTAENGLYQLVAGDSTNSALKLRKIILSGN